MGLRDAFRPRRRETDAEAAVEEADFRPRSDGWYVGTPDEGTAVPRALRFSHVMDGPGRVSGVVLNSADDDPMTGDDATHGEWTPSGFLTLQARFSRPTVLTVLESASQEQFTARCTATDAVSTVIYQFRFRSTAGQAAG